MVGLDAAQAMLAQAVRRTDAADVAYVRGDACALPFGDASFDAVCCFAALYLIERPIDALDEIARVLAPGGRVALLSSCHRGPLPVTMTGAIVRRLTGVRIFARDELTRALRRPRADRHRAARLGSRAVRVGQPARGSDDRAGARAGRRRRPSHALGLRVGVGRSGARRRRPLRHAPAPRSRRRADTWSASCASPAARPTDSARAARAAPISSNIETRRSSPSIT